MAVDYLFLVGPAASLPPLSVEQFSAREGRNDFELPWIMRGLVDAPEIKDLFPGELRDLKEGILHWKPNTRPLREIKKRVSPMFSFIDLISEADSQARARCRSSATSSTTRLAVFHFVGIARPAETECRAWG